jgi:hypothetical protein
LATTVQQADFIDLVALEIASGIDGAAGCWLGRVERELAASGLNQDEQLRAIALVLDEYKQITGKSYFRCAQA